MRVWIIEMAMCAISAAAASAQDVEGSKDHPMFSRFPNYLISNYDVSDFGSARFEDGKEGVNGPRRHEADRRQQDGRRARAEPARRAREKITSRGYHLVNSE